jgi:diguanylate cyclase (GGDEF)-like protein
VSVTIRADIVDHVVEAVGACDSVGRVCHAVVSTVNVYAGGPVTVLLASADQLALVASSGTWQAPRAVPVHYGVVGLVLATGRTVVIRDASIEYCGLHPQRPVGSVVCAPVVCPDQPAIGVINIEYDRQVPDLERWGSTLSMLGRVLGTRIQQLGGPPTESRGEQLLRHTLAFAAVTDPIELSVLACRAAVEISGLRSAVILAREVPTAVDRERPTLTVAGHYTACGSPALLDRIEGLDHERLSAMIDVACQHGASRTLGDPSGLDARGFEPLVDVGVRTLIATPVRGLIAHPLFDAVMLVVDELAVRPSSHTVSAMELLLANAAVCHERISTLHELQILADSDPLTGLRHRGAFRRRLASSSEARTALLLIDIDNFKQVNDLQGHDAGDRALVEVAAALRREARAGDEVFRVGGDEFVAVLDVHDEHDAAGIARRMAAAAADSGYSISVGLALRRADEPGKETLHRADQAMYLAKQDPDLAVWVAP